MSQKIYGDLEIKRNETIEGELKVKGSSSGSSSFKAPETGADTTYTLPSTGGKPGDSLKVDSSKNLYWADSQNSSGCLTTPTYVDNGAGSFTVNSVQVKLFNNTTFDGSVNVYTLAQQTFTLTDNAKNYIIGDYNSGTPIIRNTTNVDEINESNIVPILTVLRAGTYINILGWDTLARGLSNKLHQSIVKTERYRLENSIAISEYGTRNIQVGANILWVGANKLTLNQINSSTDNIRYFYRTGPSAWTYQSITQYNNTEYFNGTSTVTLNNNRYAVNWLYRGAEESNHLYMVLGEGDYSLFDAQNSQPPANLPFTISGHAFFIGRIIIQKNAAVATQIDTISEKTFTPKTPTSHNDLTGLQGGTANEYYHLTSAQHTLATQNASTSQTGLLSSDDWNTFNNKANDLSSITKEITGFADPSLVSVSYDSTTRTITLSGTLTAYWRGRPVTIPTTSTAHAVAEGVTYFYYYNGSSFVWSTTPWTFDMLQIAIVIFFPTYKYAIREVHGLMSWQNHKEFHETIGTYLSSGGDLSSFVLNSTTAANRRPDISVSTVTDEDLATVNPQLTSKLYTTFSLTGTTPDAVITTGYAEIVPVSGNQPYYNQNNGGTWQQTLMTNNAYQAIFLLAIPTSSDSGSQNYRYVWVQGQTQNTTLSVIQALAPSDINLNGLAVSSPEFVFIGKIIIRYTAGNWRLISTQKLTGTKFSQVGSPAGTYLSAVTTDATLTGSGTALDPLKVAVPVLSTDITNWNAKLGDSFESVSKNLKAYPYTLNYTGGNLTTIVYNLGSGNFITKTLNYTTNQLTSVVLSGNLPSGIATTKTLTYSSGILSSISYS